MNLFDMLLYNVELHKSIINGFTAPLLIIGNLSIQSIEVSFDKNIYHMELMGKVFTVIKDTYDKAKSCLT